MTIEDIKKPHPSSLVRLAIDDAEGLLLAGIPLSMPLVKRRIAVLISLLDSFLTLDETEGLIKEFCKAYGLRSEKDIPTEKYEIVLQK